ncbi:MAG TPA: Lrp/AsnC family transcriptional regulator [Lacipirellulaceae bacterium]|nr:Lrp/AsnC family transcriptional regulator [Lacipirellulaceae bacterium]
MSSESLSDVDAEILARLQRNSRISNASLAKAVGLSPSACLRRVRALEGRGFVRNYVAMLAPERLGLGASVFVQVSLEKKDEKTLQGFERAIAQCSDVLECYLMTGDSDYLLRVVVADVAAFERFLIDCLTKIPGVSTIRSSFSLKQVKYTTALPLDAVRP